MPASSQRPPKTGFTPVVKMNKGVDPAFDPPAPAKFGRTLMAGEAALLVHWREFAAGKGYIFKQFIKLNFECACAD